jgi:hypothetical protein
MKWKIYAQVPEGCKKLLQGTRMEVTQEFSDLSKGKEEVKSFFYKGLDGKIRTSCWKNSRILGGMSWIRVEEEQTRKPRKKYVKDSLNSLRKQYGPDIARVVEMVQLQKMTTLSATRCILDIMEVCIKREKGNK